MADVRPRYAFHHDGLFWTGCAAYALNRWVFKSLTHDPFLHSHFNDLWLVPCVLPLVVWLHERFGGRASGPPTLREIAAHLVLWSLLFEWAGPHLLRRATGDTWDVACYAVGGAVAWAWWHWRRPVPARQAA